MSENQSIKEQTDEEKSTSRQQSIPEEIAYDTSFVTSSVNSSIDSEVASLDNGNNQQPASASIESAANDDQGAAKALRTNSSCQFRVDKAWLDRQFHEPSKEHIKKPAELESEMEGPPGEGSRDVLDRIQGSIFGMALGDALGAHVEFRPRGYLLEHPVEDLQGGGTWGLEIGQFTDDTSMALCLANSLIARRDFVPYDQLVRYKWWFRNGYMSSTGECFDIGAATRESIEEFERRQHSLAEQNHLPEEQMDFLSDDALLEQINVFCSKDGVAGNGALMRLTPVPLFFYERPADAVLYSGLSGKITHGDGKAYDACRYYGALIVAALHGETKGQLLDPDFYERHKDWFNGEELHQDVMNIAQGSFKKTNGYEDGIRGKGYIINALEAALWAFWADGDSFQKGARDAVNLGDDTDTTAAIYGQLAGAHYGYNKLPSEWIEKVYANKFLATLSKWIAYDGHRWASSAQADLSLIKWKSLLEHTDKEHEILEIPHIEIEQPSSTSSSSSLDQSQSTSEERKPSLEEISQSSTHEPPPSPIDFTSSSIEHQSSEQQSLSSSGTVSLSPQEPRPPTPEPPPSPMNSTSSFNETDSSMQQSSSSSGTVSLSPQEPRPPTPTPPVSTKPKSSKQQPQATFEHSAGEPQTRAHDRPSTASSSDEVFVETEPTTKQTQPSSTTATVQQEESLSSAKTSSATVNLPAQEPPAEVRSFSASVDLPSEKAQLQTPSTSATLPSKESQSSVTFNLPPQQSTTFNSSSNERPILKPEPRVLPVTSSLRSEQYPSSKSSSATSNQHFDESSFRSEGFPSSRREEPRSSTSQFKSQSVSPAREEQTYGYPITLPVNYGNSVRTETYYESSPKRNIHPSTSTHQSSAVHHANEMRSDRQQNSYSSNAFRNGPSTSKPLYQGKNLAKWTNSDVCHWIDSLGANFKSYADRFRKEGTDGYGLFTYVGRRTLNDFGIYNEEHQKTILDGIQTLKNRLATSF